ncbi:Flp family type IVb pilin [Marinobacterium weihaiense]|uniref:Pilus assembly protein n=1 Tax=Marinobacterium weihaiense TaxID=2851016 RepID=A0ABS6MCP4_9GAMM|nr:pilus assembly protein [Marinobacterium weihaiense]MBV0933497.1 pilus assembly protein [Marinobacterium weihaiense]
MNMMTRKIMDFIKDEEGLTTVEYAIAGALVAAIVVAAFTDLGCEVAATVQYLADVISDGEDAVRGACGDA